MGTPFSTKSTIIGQCLHSYDCNMTDEKILAVSSSKLRVLSLETGKELIKLPDDMVREVFLVIG